ncbi:DUF2339 domain-containing protein [Adhaeribacter pallidiroseus]|uniref:DUF2339 domain-containing protein n=1 Tax=Adhaeribacter pallidiroseus TaxID=2072847 RepID=A0A369QHY8_9BACT|nr:DUF2339 domain-containing protein [Adhaeribacter pallidiroseus]RDC64501.1 hypothetical protein AHMF7616_03115 [Adhaeribacter pallidiroseus]
MEPAYFIILLIGLLALILLLIRLLGKIQEISAELRQLRQEIARSAKSPSNSATSPGVFISDTSKPVAMAPVIHPSQAGTVPPNPIPVQTTNQVRKAAVRRPGFFERNPDLEKFIGENLVNKLGIAVLVLGIGYFIKFAIDQDWINAWGRVLIGFGCGFGLLGLAHWLRGQYAAFSSVLVGGGLAVLYFTIALAFHEYHLFPQTLAFILMVAVTGLSVFMALLYDRQELAVLALLGGFASPLLASSGGNNYQILFIYILILNIGMLVLAFFKKWPLITIISYLATVILFGGWLFAKVIGELQAPYLGGFIFASLFYLVFFAMLLIYNLKQQQAFSLLEISILLSNTFFFYICGLYLLHGLGGGTYLGLFSGILAFFNGAAAWQLYQQKTTDPKLRYLLGSIGLLLLYLAILFELTFRLGSSTTDLRAIKYLVVASYHYLFALIIIRFLPATVQARWPLTETLAGLSFTSYLLLVQPVVQAARNNYLLNSTGSLLPFALHYSAIVLLLILLYQVYRYYQKAYGLRSKNMNAFTWFGCTALVYLASTELDHLVLLFQFSPGENLNNLLQQEHKIGFPILWGLASFGFMLLGMRYKLKTLRLVSLTLFFITLLKLFLFDIRNISAGGRIAAFISLGILLLVVSFLYQKLKNLLLDDVPPEKVHS